MTVEEFAKKWRPVVVLSQSKYRQLDTRREFDTDVQVLEAALAASEQRVKQLELLPSIQIMEELTSERDALAARVQELESQLESAQQLHQRWMHAHNVVCEKAERDRYREIACSEHYGEGKCYGNDPLCEICKVLRPSAPPEA